MTLPTNGLSNEEILSSLEELRSDDAPTTGGRVLAYVYDSGLAGLEEIAETALAKFAGVNCLDPTVFPSVARLENDLVGWGLDLLGGDEQSAGLVTSGGTESCMLAVKAAREVWRAKVGETTDKPILIAPVTVHPAFIKGAAYFGFDVDLVPIDTDEFRVSPDAISQALERAGERAALVVVSSPAYPYGVMDPIVEVAAIAQAAGVPCHSDACIGGWTLPYLKRAGHDIEPFDLSVPGVTSISVDLHKYAYAPKGTSLLLFDTAARRGAVTFTYSGWPGYPVVNMTSQSTKSAGPMAAAWTVLAKVGDEGFVKLASDAGEATQIIADGVTGIPGIRMLGKPNATLIAVAGDESDDAVDPFRVADEMGKRNWFVQAQPAADGLPRTIHFTVQAASLPTAHEFVEALRESVEAAAGEPWAEPDPQLIAAAESIDVATLDDATVAGLLTLAGLGGADEGDIGLPEEAATVQALLEALPTDLRNRLLAGFFSLIYTAQRPGLPK